MSLRHCSVIALRLVAHDDVTSRLPVFVVCLFPTTIPNCSFAAQATTVLWIGFLPGDKPRSLINEAVSLDPKPLLTKLDGKPFPGKLRTLFPYPGNIMKSPFEFKQHGESGHHVSNVFPHVAKHVDEITFLNACVSNEQNHVPACYVVNTGRQQVGSPNLGSWATYGLARESRDLPDYVVMYDRRAAPEGGAKLWS